MNEPRLFGLFELSAQVSDIDRQGVRTGIEVVAPDEIEDLITREHLPRVVQEQFEQVEFNLREFH